MAQAMAWTPYNSLTQAPTNLKEAIDWVLRVTGKDGKKNTAASPPQPPASPPQFSCLCFLAKAVKDLLYDARSPESPGPSSGRYWDDLLLEEEITIVKPVLTDLGLVKSDSTSATSTTSTCAGGTEVIKSLIDHLAQGLQKWVGWQDGNECCLKGDSGESNGIGKGCTCSSTVGGSGQCCNGGSGTGGGSHECGTCGTGAKGGATNCYLSAYCKPTNPPSGESYWPTISSDPEKVHLLARIFLGSVCLIWSGLSQLGFLTGGSERWKDSNLHEIKDNGTSGLGSFMAAMGYDLERLNQEGNKKGEFVQKLLTGEKLNGKDGIKWQEFASVKGANQESVAEYYSSIYTSAKEAAKGSAKNTEDICKQYPLLVLHILASGYFRAGSAGANKVTVPAKPATTTPKTTSASDDKKEDTPRKPRTIREILYWLSALPYSQGYKDLVERMKDKYPRNEKDPQKPADDIKLYDEKASSVSTNLYKEKITHYLLAACGYCPLVLIGIQGTIEKEVKSDAEAAAKSAPAPAAPDGKLKDGEVCYGGYHLEVKQFGPLHGMYANGLFGFDLGGSPAQCLDQLRVYVYHCFYQLYFLRKQCKVGVDKGAVLGWNSCRYGSGVNSAKGVSNQNVWICKKPGSGAGQECQCKTIASPQSPLMYFLCDALGLMVCHQTKGKSPDSETNPYPEIVEHVNTKDDNPKGHFDKPLLKFPQICPVPMGWSNESSNNNRNTGIQIKVNHFKDLKDTHKTLQLTGGSPSPDKYPAHCTGNTLSLLLEYYCDPGKSHGSLVLVLRLLACITPTVPRTLGDLFGFYYYIVYIGGKNNGGGKEVNTKLTEFESEVVLYMGQGNAVVQALTTWSSSGNCSAKNDTLKCLIDCSNGSSYLSPLSGQQYGQLSPLMAGTYLSWLAYLIEGFNTAVS